MCWVRINQFLSLLGHGTRSDRTPKFKKNINILFLVLSAYQSKALDQTNNKVAYRQASSRSRALTDRAPLRSLTVNKRSHVNSVQLNTSASKITKTNATKNRTKQWKPTVSVIIYLILLYLFFLLQSLSNYFDFQPICNTLILINI